MHGGGIILSKRLSNTSASTFKSNNGRAAERGGYRIKTEEQQVYNEFWEENATMTYFWM